MLILKIEGNNINDELIINLKWGEQIKYKSIKEGVFKMKISMKTLKEYGIITLGVILLAISLEYFYYPNDIAAGGVSGLALVV
ncbi:YitT family protein, partial [Pseudomonas protegens]|nr:YitT family protein [Pseudomonas protegens]